MNAPYILHRSRQCKATIETSCKELKLDLQIIVKDLQIDIELYIILLFIYWIS